MLLVDKVIDLNLELNQTSWDKILDVIIIFTKDWGLYRMLFIRLFHIPA